MSSSPLVIVLLGPPGVGKGSQASKLCKKLNLPHISTGEILREHIKNETDLGNSAKELIESGKLVPDELINDMVEERVQMQDCEKGYILDGYPRTALQAKSFQKYLENSVPKPKVKVINFDAQDRTITERISGRLTCKDCFSAFHTIFNPPKVEKVCDSCHGPLYQRADDDAKVVLERLRVYKSQTSSVIDFYKEKNLLNIIECEKPIDTIFDQTIELINA